MSTDPALLIALATELEKEGQYNASKLLRAGATAMVTDASTAIDVPSDATGLAVAVEEVASSLDGVSGALAGPLRAAAAALREGGVALYREAPDPHVCRICGLTRLEPFTARCERCGRWQGTAEQFRPIYWARASTPPEALALLSATPDAIGRILAGGATDRPGPDGGWSAEDTLAHLHNAQRVFRGRIDQLVRGDEPDLASVMVWTMDGDDEGVEALLSNYRELRTDIVGLLGEIDPAVWWNAGSHEEFGRVTLAEQASYFANHEPTHLAQMADAVG